MGVARQPNAFEVARAFLDSGYIGRRFFEQASPLTREGVAWAMAMNNPAYDSLRLSFLEQTLNADYLTQTKDAGATNYAISTSKAGGAIIGATGASSGDGQSLLTGKNWQGNLNAFMWVRWQHPTITTLAWENGFIDDVTDKTTPVVTAQTPTIGAGAGDVAVITSNTGFTTATAQLATLGSTPYAAAINPFKHPRDGTAKTFAPVAATYYYSLVALNGDNVHAGLFNAAGVLQARTQKVAGIAGATLLSAWVAMATLSAASKATLINDIFVMQDAA